jgi:hypothetical protein
MTTDCAQWRVVSAEPIAPQRFGRDHYSTLLYVETCAVDCGGRLDHDRMRCDLDRHPVLAAAGAHSALFGEVDGHANPTRLRSVDGRTEEVADHDDYDCLDDLVAAGWLTVQMPTADAGEDVYRITGGIVTDGSGAPIRPSALTGVDELTLGAAASWHLTDTGYTITAAARRHLADGGSVDSLPDVLFLQPN